jgi:endoglucanase
MKRKTMISRWYSTLMMSLLLPVSIFAQPTANEWNANVVGWNLGNQFECSAPGQDGESMQIGMADNSIKAETAWGNPVVTKKVIKAVKEAGFNAVRIPVRWQCHITNAAAMSIDKAWMARIKEVVGWCLQNDLKVIINTHHDKWLEGRPTNQYKEENNQKLALLWLNIASEFANYDYRVAFAGTNEVHIRDNWGKPTAENLAVQNSYNQTFIDVVRATGGNNAKRHLIVQTYVCNPDFGLYNGDFIIPTDEENGGLDYVSVEFHYYTPYDYAGECKYNYWGEPYKDKGEASPSDEKTMTEFMDRVINTWANKGLGIVMGEWGVSDRQKAGQTDLIHENMTYYCSFLVSEAKKRGISTFIWDNNSFGSGMEKFGIFDRNSGMKVKADWIIKGIMEGKAK